MSPRSTLLCLLTCATVSGARTEVRPSPVSAFDTISQSSDRQTRSDEAERTASMSGVVRSIATGHPISTVRVALKDNQRTRAVAVTDQDGRFEIRDVAAGRYAVAFERVGFLPMHYGQLYPGGRVKMITLRAGERLTGIDSALWPGGSIEGHIQDEKGLPVADALVSANQVRSVGGNRELVPVGITARTDRAGEYHLRDLAPAEYVVSASVRIGATITSSAERDDTPREESSGYAPMFAPGVPDAADAATVLVRPAAEVPGVDIVLRPFRLSRISGQLVTSSGVLHDGAHVAVVPARTSGLRTAAQRFVGIGESDAVGRFTVKGVPPGHYILKALSIPKAVGELAARTGDPSHLLKFSDAEFGEVPVVVTGDDVSGLVIATSKGGTIKGRLLVGPRRMMPVGPRQILIRAEPGSSVAFGVGATEAAVNEDGTFEIRGLIGQFLIRPHGLPDGLSLKRVDSNSRDVTDSGLNVQPGTSNVSVVLTSNPTELTGYVTGCDDDDVGECAVLVFSEDPERWHWPATRYVRTARVRPDGAFTVSGLPPAAYLAIAVNPQDREPVPEPVTLGYLSRHASRVTLQEGERRSIVLRLLLY